MISQMRTRPDFKKKKWNLNYRQNNIPINLHDNKYQSHEHCTFFIRSEFQYGISFFHQTNIFDVFQQQMFDQSPCGDYLNPSTVP